MEQFSQRKEKINNFLTKTHLDQSERKSLNKKLDVVNNYFKEIPLDQISQILDEHDLVILQEDGTEWSGILCGREGVCRLEVGDKYSMKLVNDIPTYTPLENSLLIFTWYKMTNSYEIVCYMS